jgi:hypothetical protein
MNSPGLTLEPNFEIYNEAFHHEDVPGARFKPSW